MVIMLKCLEELGDIVGNREVSRMSNEEAIAFLQSRIDLIDKYYPQTEDYREALVLAIKALKNVPTENEEVIRISKDAVKARTGRFVVYDVEWLKEHFNTTEAQIYGQPSVEPKQRWIPVSEKLPEENTYVLVTVQVGKREPKVRSGYYYKDGHFHIDNGDSWGSKR